MGGQACVMENHQEPIRLSVKVLLILFMLVLNMKCDDMFSRTSRSALGLLFNGCWGSSLGGRKQLGHEVNHSAAFSAEVKNEWSCSSSP